MQKSFLAFFCFMLMSASIAQSAPQTPTVQEKTALPASEPAKLADEITEISVAILSAGPPDAFFDDGYVRLQPDTNKKSYVSDRFQQLADWLRSSGVLELKEIHPDAHFGSHSCPGVRVDIKHNDKWQSIYFYPMCYTRPDATQIQKRIWEAEMLIRGTAADIQRYNANQERIKKRNEQQNKPAAPAK